MEKEDTKHRMKIDRIFREYKNPYHINELFEYLYTKKRENIPIQIMQYRIPLYQIAEVLEGCKRIHMLEIGAYIGLFVDLMQKNFKNVTIQGIDIEKSFCKIAQKNGIDVRNVSAYDVKESYPGNSFDIVIAQGVVAKEIMAKDKDDEEFYERIEKIIDGVTHILKKGGIFLFNNIDSIPKHILGNYGLYLESILKDSKGIEFWKMRKH